MRTLRLELADGALALWPLAWTSTIAPPAQPIHEHDDSGKEITLARKAVSVPVAEVPRCLVRCSALQASSRS